MKGCQALATKRLILKGGTCMTTTTVETTIDLQASKVTSSHTHGEKLMSGHLEDTLERGLTLLNPVVACGIRMEAEEETLSRPSGLFAEGNGVRTKPSKDVAATQTYNTESTQFKPCIMLAKSIRLKGKERDMPLLNSPHRFFFDEQDRWLCTLA